MSGSRRDEYLTVRETAEIVGLHPVTVRRKILDGTLPGVRLGAKGAPVRVNRGELDEWLDSNHVRPAGRRGNPGRDAGAVDVATAAPGSGAGRDDG